MTIETIKELEKRAYRWNGYAIRNFCVRHNFYTGGDCQQYSIMLDFVDNSEPTESAIRLVATDIAFHSYESDGSAFSVYSSVDNVVNNITDAILKEVFGIEE